MSNPELIARKNIVFFQLYIERHLPRRSYMKQNPP